MSAYNLHQVFHQSTLSEKREGYLYFEQQFKNLESFSVVSKLPVDRVVAAFAALSPNNAESTNYAALASCIAIVLGKVPPTAPVIAYPRDRTKALTLLQDFRTPIEAVLRGRKTYSFYRNTLNPADPKYVTIDGHIHNAWSGKVQRLNTVDMTSKLYSTIQRDMVTVSRKYDLTPAQIQAIIWLTWKRLHRILSSPQLSLESGVSQFQASLMIDQAPESRTSYPDAAGPSTEKDTCTTHPVQSLLELGETNLPTVP